MMAQSPGKKKEDREIRGQPTRLAGATARPRRGMNGVSKHAPEAGHAAVFANPLVSMSY
jgi:hypothetical protein